MFNIKNKVGGGTNMMNLISNILKGIGGFASNFGTNACVMVFIDEPECPQSLIK